MITPDEEKILREALAIRESKMYGYYSSVMKENFEGGYPTIYDDEFISHFNELLKAREEQLDKDLENSAWAKAYRLMVIEEMKEKLVETLLKYKCGKHKKLLNLIKSNDDSKEPEV